VSNSGYNLCGNESVGKRSRGGIRALDRSGQVNIESRYKAT
jgi:hypothetical protein